jgi:hypothetical protein
MSKFTWQPGDVRATMLSEFCRLERHSECHSTACECFCHTDRCADDD